MDVWKVELYERYPMPDTKDVESFYFSVDGGGREMVMEALIKYDVRLMLEIGCFLCGSTIQWLETRNDLTVIGIDPWAGSFAKILDRYKHDPVFDKCFARISDRDAFIESVRKNGPFVSAVANVRQFRNRFFPVKAYSPAVLSELVSLGIQPQLIYFDSNKVLDDLVVCRDFFPNAILTGDDWTWGADKGYPARTAVMGFCEKNGLKVTSRNATWLIEPQCA